ncbi:MAG: hypothetical protein BIP78_0070 [Candidatus Bipolaricaulis sibiricus]|uniref:Uncharacterized protein n=1 Tax=Bipolaricaulis sibiricus TaxID=2501609 RepID=A0A410FSD7_BIPS1|nr:MAG: hypothetical protein BIP78_0070 [Candidatus Bipolaricaulis sibiricus]
MPSGRTGDSFVETLAPGQCPSAEDDGPGETDYVCPRSAGDEWLQPNLTHWRIIAIPVTTSSTPPNIPPTPPR